MKRVFLILLCTFAFASCETEQDVMNDVSLEKRAQELINYKNSRSKNVDPPSDWNWSCGSQPTDWLGFPTGSTAVVNYDNYDGTTTTIVSWSDGSYNVVPEGWGLLWCEENATWTQGPFSETDTGN